MIQLIICHEHPKFTEMCLHSLYENTPNKLLNIIVVDNGSKQKIDRNMVNDELTTIVELTQNYGVGTAANIGLDFLLKSEGLVEDDLFLLTANDHYFFPNWHIPFYVFSGEYDVAYGSIAVSEQVEDTFQYWKHNRKLHDELRIKYLDYPEQRSKIRLFLEQFYGKNLEDFLEKEIYPYIQEKEKIQKMETFWPGCWVSNRHFLSTMPAYGTQFIAGHDDLRWKEAVVDRHGRMVLLPEAYIHHFGSITTRRGGDQDRCFRQPKLTMSSDDHFLHRNDPSNPNINDAPPRLTDRDRSIIEYCLEEFIGKLC